MTDETIDITHYRYAVAWSPEDEEFVATVAEFPSLSWLEPDQIEALKGLARLVASVVEDMRASGEPVPPPLADRSFSGRLNLRVSAQLHRRLATEALQHQESLNAYASSLLERQLTA
ncbi:type II toxin-antitoxin system HicB family antitoxin [uncultured Amnibacterium sp.]|uniref:type II toxin-antitoxin system HicB family antitoxin n=1 Tax=uncultured Amnibacterium sp. TaxID=1631851 RepID=UPI0035CBABE2